jgi:hypothetical protein
VWTWKLSILIWSGGRYFISVSLNLAQFAILPQTCHSVVSQEVVEEEVVVYLVVEVEDRTNADIIEVLDCNIWVLTTPIQNLGNGEHRGGGRGKPRNDQEPPSRSKKDIEAAQQALLQVEKSAVIYCIFL